MPGRKRSVDLFSPSNTSGESLSDAPVRRSARLASQAVTRNVNDQNGSKKTRVVADKDDQSEKSDQESTVRPPSRLAHLHKGKPTILSLPDELLNLIVGNLSTEERQPLYFVCKKLRAIDISHGRKEFETITIQMLPTNEFYHHTDLVVSGLSCVRNGRIEMHNLRGGFSTIYRYFESFIRNGRVGRLKITHARRRHCPADAQFLRRLFRSVKIDCLEVQHYGEETSADKLLSHLNLSQTCVTLEWMAHRDHSPSAARQLLRNLPKMKDLNIEWSSRNSEPLLDDAIVLYLSNQTLQKFKSSADGNFTVQGIQKILETVQASGNPLKKVSLKSYSIVGSLEAADLNLEKRIEMRVNRSYGYETYTRILWFVNDNGQSVMRVNGPSIRMQIMDYP